jgi:hypothetical protein
VVVVDSLGVASVDGGSDDELGRGAAMAEENRREGGSRGDVSEWMRVDGVVAFLSPRRAAERRAGGGVRAAGDAGEVDTATAPRDATGRRRSFRGKPPGLNSFYLHLGPFSYFLNFQ